MFDQAQLGGHCLPTILRDLLPETASSMPENAKHFQASEKERLLDTLEHVIEVLLEEQNRISFMSAIEIVQSLRQKGDTALSPTRSLELESALVGCLERCAEECSKGAMGENTQVHSEVGDALIGPKHPDTLRRLLALVLYDPNESIRHVAAVGLKGAADEIADWTLCRVLSDPRSGTWLRRRCLDGLCGTPFAGTHKKLLATALASEPQELNYFGFGAALAVNASREMLDVLILTLNSHPEPNVRLMCVEALSITSDRDSQMQLYCSMIDDTDHQVRGRAAYALSKSPELNPEILKLIKEHLDHLLPNDADISRYPDYLRSCLCALGTRVGGGIAETLLKGLQKTLEWKFEVSSGFALALEGSKDPLVVDRAKALLKKTPGSYEAGLILKGTTEPEVEKLMAEQILEMCARGSTWLADYLPRSLCRSETQEAHMALIAYNRRVGGFNGFLLRPSPFLAVQRELLADLTKEESLRDEYYYNAITLGRSPKHPEIIAALIEGLTAAKSDQEKSIHVYSLLDVPTQEACELIWKTLNATKSEELQLVCLGTLALQSDLSEQRRVITEIGRERHPNVRIRSASRLSVKLQDELVPEIIETFRQSQDPMTRACCLAMLKNRGELATQQIFGIALGDTSFLVRHVAAFTLSGYYKFLEIGFR